MKRHTMVHRSPRTPRGTTLVEVMAAAALSVLLLSALVLAMQTMRRQEAVLLASDHVVEPWKRRLQTTIEWDLVNSRTWNHRFSSLQLIGFAGQDATDRTQHGPTQIHYRFVSSGNEVWLVRESTALSTPTGTTQRTLLCRGVAKILIGRPEDDLRSLLAPRGEFDAFFPIPGRVRCVLVNANDQPIMDFILLRDGGGT